MVAEAVSQSAARRGREKGTSGLAKWRGVAEQWTMIAGAIEREKYHSISDGYVASRHF